MEAIITLTTDFGLSDGYVAAMKGVMLGINPRAHLVDIGHFIMPQNISQAAFILASACPFFPRGTVHTVVVDPGVGTERRPIAVRTPVASFVAPDNGVLTHALEPFLDGSGEAKEAHETGLRLGAEAFVLNRSEYWRKQVSPTFHGRDIFAPAAAHLSRGVAFADMGEHTDSIVALALPRPRRESDGSLVGHIVHIDHFGNLITDVRGGDLPPALPLTVEIGSEIISGMSHSYAEGRELVVVLGSSGRLEIARRNGSAAAYLKVKTGDEFRIRFLSEV